MFKCCIVTDCLNDSFRTPNKIFIHVPMKLDVRDAWFKAMNQMRIGCNKSRLYCCEDHFNLQEDAENFIKFKMVGGTIIIKQGVVPHIFKVNEDKREEYMQEDPQPSTSKASQHLPTADDTLHYKQDVRSDPQDSHIEEEIMEPKEKRKRKNPRDTYIPRHTVGTQTFVDATEKSTQTALREKSIHFRSRGTSTKLFNVADAMSSPIKIGRKPDTTSTSELSDSVSDNESGSGSKEITLSSDYTGSISPVIYPMKTSFIKAIKKDSKLFLGIPNDMYHVIDLLVEKLPLRVEDILITLKKIKLDESNKMLAIHFDMSESAVCKIFLKSIKLLASCFEELIIWPPSADIRRQLPQTFRARYSKVQAIIDCFEIQIEKPSNPMHQSLTWSEYKKCNTLKYFVSCLPNGLINFISAGYNGRATDTVIFKDCGFMNHLRPGMAVLADRGFKNIAHILESHQCTLIRPPSVSANTICTRDQVKESKVIASLRIHVERVIGRIREFQMLTIHSTIDHSYIPIVDHIVVIACGIVNLQNALL